MSKKKPLSVPEVADIREVHRSTVYRWIDTGGLKATRMGRDFFVDPADLEKFTPAPTGNPKFAKGKKRPRAKVA